MNTEIGTLDKINIYMRTAFKILRGGVIRLFLKQAKGFLLVGKHVKITHSRHIICGKNVKFEDYAEIQGLCSEGLNFGDYVTISRGVMIRPSSYYGGGSRYRLNHGRTFIDWSIWLCWVLWTDYNWKKCYVWT